MICVQQQIQRDPENGTETVTSEEAMVADHMIGLKGDPLLIKMLINNLVEHALKYSPKDMPVTVSVDEAMDELQLSVIDCGAGIPDAQSLGRVGGQVGVPPDNCCRLGELGIVGAQA